jgi:PQQ-dependent dehydrogenase (methanol/ethanol family)
MLVYLRESHADQRHCLCGGLEAQQNRDRRLIAVHKGVVSIVAATTEPSMLNRLGMSIIRRPFIGALFAVLIVFVFNPVSAEDLDQAKGTKVTERTGDTAWPTYNLDYEGHRYAELDAINTRNVSLLEEHCRATVGEASSFETDLILADGRLYATTSLATLAINPSNCQIIWKNVYQPERREVAPNNRGVAFEDGRVFRGTDDCSVLALSARTGETLWKISPCDPEAGEYFAAAPIAWSGMVLIGIAGGDFGVQGRMFAFDAASGRKIWEFHLIPQKDEFGADTWKGQSGATGGGGTWTTYTLDPASGELFIPVGNAAPDFNSDFRFGADLFTNSVVVLDARTGALKWWYQINIHDDKDFDVSAAPMLFDLENGKQVVALAPKDGMLYAIDRHSHKLLYKTPITTIMSSMAPVTEQGTRACPGIFGGVEWNGPALDRLNHAIVVGAVDWCSVLTRSPDSAYKRGEAFLGGTYKMLSDPPATGWVTSVDQQSGRIRWHFHADGPVVSGILPTAGGLVFFGDMAGNFYALDSADGTVRFKANTGGAIAGGVISYRLNEYQYVAVTAGNVSRFDWGASGTPQIILYRQKSTPTASKGEAGTSAVVASDVPDAARGQSVYGRVCTTCHGPAGEGLSAPTLKGVGRRMSVGEIAAWVLNPLVLPGKEAAATMPRLYPSALTGQDLFDVAAFVSQL